MGENRYNPCVITALKAEGLLPKSKKLDRNDMYRAIFNICDPTVTMPLLYETLRATGQPLPTMEQLRAMVADHSTVMVMETVNMFHGVLIHVEDADLVRALLRTKVEAIGGEVRMPFPVVEFAFPSGIDMGNDMEVNGCIVIDLNQFNIHNELRQSGTNFEIVGSDRGRPKARIAVISRMKKNGVEDIDACIYQFAEDSIINNYEEYLEDKYKSFIEKQAMFVMALILYIQHFNEKEEVLELMDHCTRMPPGMPSAFAKVAKKRKGYHLKDMLDMGAQYRRMDRGGSHKSPEGHWRTWVIRVLRHMRYQRKPDGSFAISIVPPCWIGPKHDDGTMKSERTLGHVVHE